MRVAVVLAVSSLTRLCKHSSHIRAKPSSLEFRGHTSLQAGSSAPGGP